MYISKLVLNPNSYRVQKELSNPYQLHRTLMCGFPNNLKKLKRDGRILFRIEKKENQNYPLILIQSTLCPDWSFLIEDEGYLLKNPLFKQFNFPQFKKGNTFWFRLFANPTKKDTGKRVGMYTEEEQYEWLKRKCELCGFNIIHVNITRKENITAKVNKKSKTMTFQGIQFEGVLQIKDSKQFNSTLKNGIGSAKAFGFGLLSIAKL